MPKDAMPVNDGAPGLSRIAMAEGISWVKVAGKNRFRFEAKGRVEFPAFRRVTAHVHGFYEFGVVLSGRGELQLRQESFPLEENRVYVVEAGRAHRVVGCSEEGLNCWVFHVTPEPFSGDQRVPSMPGISTTRVSESASLLQFIRSWESLSGPSSAGTLSLSLFARLLAAEIQSLLADEKPESGETVVDCARKLIEQWLPQKIEVSRLAGELEVSERTLRRHFQKSLQSSVMAYIHNRRLRQAQMLLAHHLPVEEVAGRVGFGSGSQLTRLFRNSVGETPKQWQQRVSPTRRLPAKQAIPSDEVSR